MIFPGNKRKAVTLSYDDNVIQNKRLIEVLNKYGLKCTFNINGGIFLPKWFRFSKIYKVFSKKFAEKISISNDI